MSEPTIWTSYLDGLTARIIGNQKRAEAEAAGFRKPVPGCVEDVVLRPPRREELPGLVEVEAKETEQWTVALGDLWVMPPSMPLLWEGDQA